jgi:ABC-type multidrug transport system fused ATPase/permease subunit
VNEEKIQEVVRYSGLGKDMKLFPDGLETIVGERGVSLSGGQKQRMSLARALMRDAEFYLLDDCLSAVDAETESTIIEGLKKALYGKTILMSSHRIAPIMRADKIMVIEDGKIMAVGKHEELLERNEYYRWLFENQSVES